MSQGSDTHKHILGLYIPVENAWQQSPAGTKAVPELPQRCTTQGLGGLSFGCTLTHRIAKVSTVPLVKMHTPKGMLQRVSPQRRCLGHEDGREPSGGQTSLDGIRLTCCQFIEREGRGLGCRKSQ